MMRKYNYVFYIADAPNAAAADQESHTAADENCSAAVAVGRTTTKRRRRLSSHRRITLLCLFNGWLHARMLDGHGLHVVQVDVAQCEP